MIKHVTLKIGNMRKPQEFIVYPSKEGENLTIQSEDCIAKVDVKTGQCKWTRNKGGAFFLHLAVGGNKGKGEATLTQEVVKALLDAQPKSGDSIGPGASVGQM